MPDDLRVRVEQRNAAQGPLLKFLLTQIGQLPLTGTNSIYRRAVLPSRHLVS